MIDRFKQTSAYGFQRATSQLVAVARIALAPALDAGARLQTPIFVFHTAGCSPDQGRFRPARCSPPSFVAVRDKPLAFCTSLDLTGITATPPADLSFFCMLGLHSAVYSPRSPPDPQPLYPLVLHSCGASVLGRARHDVNSRPPQVLRQRSYTIVRLPTTSACFRIFRHQPASLFHSVRSRRGPLTGLHCYAR